MASQPRLGPAILVNPGIRPNKSAGSTLRASSSRTLGLNWVEIENRHLDLGGWLCAGGSIDWPNHLRDFRYLSWFRPLSIS